MFKILFIIPFLRLLSRLAAKVNVNSIKNRSVWSKTSETSHLTRAVNLMKPSDSYAPKQNGNKPNQSGLRSNTGFRNVPEMMFSQTSTYLWILPQSKFKLKV